MTESNGTFKSISAFHCNYTAEVAELFFTPFVHRKKEKGNGLRVFWQEIAEQIWIGMFFQLCVMHNLNGGCSNFLKLKFLRLYHVKPLRIGEGRVKGTSVSEEAVMGNCLCP